jgi:mRNA interferase YafQ
MKELIPTTQYKKDFKKYKHKTKKLKKLFEIYCLLQQGKKIPESYNPHPLTGSYVCCMECHIESDFLLIWIDEENNIIKLVRLGSHSDLFE